MAYSELFCQSNFSFLTGASDPEELVSTAAFYGYNSLAITDECSVAGVVRAYTEIKNSRLPVKLITGSYFEFSESLRFILICPDRTAYAELCRIITNARRRAKKGEYQLAEWDIRSVRHCQIIWLPDLNQEQNQHWGEWLARYHASRCWIGAQRLLNDTDTALFSIYKQLNNTYSFPVLACTGALFHHPERLPLQQVMHAIRDNTQVNKLGVSAEQNAERSLRPIKKITKLYPADWIANAVKLAGACDFCLSELRYEYPSEIIPDGLTAQSYLRQCVEQGILRRFPDGVPGHIRDIIEKEMTLIAEQQYEYFFLTLYDIVQFARREKILYQGRGSAANSVVCYCLEITAVDPRQINVLFERFISKERDEPPDIDVDFEHDRREEVIQYIYRKYGRQRTALAATVICFRFKSAFREVGKALGFQESQLDYVIKNINRRDKALPWQAQIKQCGLNPGVKKVKQLVMLVESIVGFPRHLSQHVGGFVISSGPLYELVPVENAAMDERTVIQWDKDDLESLGLLKVDILALGMLSAIRRTFDLLSTQYSVPVNIPFITALGDDTQVYDMICTADTVGVFQIESRAQMSMLPRLRPRCYYDLVVQIAIVRPGPIQGDMVHPYLKRRHGELRESYPSKEVQKVLARTMGVPIFQEQVIQLAMVAAGFSGGEADQLRRAMASWKKNGKLNLFRDKLIQGMLQKGYNLNYAEQLFEQIKGFSGYGFPESHSASFAVLAYVSCWLKYYFPVEFYIGLMNSWPMGFYTPSQLVQDARHHGITVLPVCINASDDIHSLCLVNNLKCIRLGFNIVKGLSEDGITTLIAHRPKQGFTSLNQIKALPVKNGDLEALASADAFTCFADNRFKARWELMNDTRQAPLLSDEPDQSTFDFDPDDRQNLLEDYASTSLSVKSHPIEIVSRYHDLSRFTQARELASKQDKSVVHIIGAVTCRQAPGTASGVTFITLEDHTGNVNVVIWQSTARHQLQPYLKATILQVDGIIEKSPEGVMHVIAGKLTDRSDWLHSLTVSSRDFH